MVVGTPKNVAHFIELVGKVSTDLFIESEHDVHSKNIFVTEEYATHKTLAELDLYNKFNLKVTRVFRSGMELLAQPNLRLNYGDRLRIVGNSEAIIEVEKIIGNSEKRLLEPDFLSLFGGLIIGIIIGSIPIFIPSLPVPLKLGFAAGPLLTALFISRYGGIGIIHSYINNGAVHFMKDLGICLFFAAVGIHAGESFYSNFIKFNESLDRDINKLKSDVTDAFAYISDENQVSIEIKLSEVIVEIKTILPSSTIHTDLEEYINKHSLWNETLLDINVAVEQLKSKGDIGFLLKVNTVGNVRINFFIINEKLFKVDDNSIIISRINLTKLISDSSIIGMNDRDESHSFNRNEIRFYFSSPKTPEQQIEFSEKVTNIFTDNGLINVGADNDTSYEGLKIKVYNYNVDSILLEIYQFKTRNNIPIRNRYKNVKIQHTI